MQKYQASRSVMHNCTSTGQSFDISNGCDAALSVIFLRYKHISICAKVAHIAYQPISAEIYLLATYSVLAQEYHVCYMCMGRHICDLAASVQANCHVIFLCYMHAGHHICNLAASVQANGHVIFLRYMRASRHIWNLSASV